MWQFSQQITDAVQQNHDTVIVALVAAISGVLTAFLSFLGLILVALIQTWWQAREHKKHEAFTVNSNVILNKRFGNGKGTRYIEDPNTGGEAWDEPVKKQGRGT